MGAKIIRFKQMKEMGVFKGWRGSDILFRYILTKPTEGRIKITTKLSFFGKIVSTLLFPIWWAKEGIDEAVDDVKKVWKDCGFSLDIEPKNKEWESLNNYYSK